MPADPPSPVLYVVACGGPPARQLPDFVGPAQEQGWEVCVIATPDGTKFLDTTRLTEQTGHPVRSQYKGADDPDVLPAADAFVVAPASFNTVNKWALGISDTLALGLLCEAVGLDLPMAAVPWPNAPLARHPAFQRSLAALRDWGVQVIFDAERLPGVAGGGAPFPWADLLAALPALRR